MMTQPKQTVATMALLLFMASRSCQIASGQGAGWLTFDKCPVKAEHVVDVPTQEGGILEKLNVELNQPVVAGAVLAELETQMARWDLLRAQQELSAAANLEFQDASIVTERATLKYAEDKLSSYRAIGESASEGELHDRTWAVEQAKHRFMQAQDNKRRAIHDRDLKEIAVKVAELRLARRQITAPLAGIVMNLKVHAGQSLEAGQPLLQVMSLDTLIIDRLVPLDQVNLAELVGAEVRVDVAQADGPAVRLSGQVVSYDPEVSSGGKVRLHARVKNLKRGNDWILLHHNEVTMHVAYRGQPAGGEARALISAPKATR